MVCVYIVFDATLDEERRRWLSLYLFVTLSHGMHCDGHRGTGLLGVYIQRLFLSAAVVEVILSMRLRAMSRYQSDNSPYCRLWHRRDCLLFDLITSVGTFFYSFLPHTHSLLNISFPITPHPHKLQLRHCLDNHSK